MQQQGIYSNQKRQERDFQIKNKRQEQAIQANNYNKDMAVLKMKQLERIKRSPRQQQFRKVLLAKEHSRDQFLNHGHNQSFSNSNINSKPDLQNLGSKQFSIQRDYHTNPQSPGLPSINGSDVKGSNIFGLPQRAKDNLKDQIYNYDSVYNVFGRHYTKRYQRNSQNSQKLSIISDPAVSSFQQNQIASKQKLINKTPVPGDLRKQAHSNLIGENVQTHPHRAVSISPAKFNRQIQRDSSHINRMNKATLNLENQHQALSQHKSDERAKSKLQQNNSQIKIEQNDYSQIDKNNEIPPLSQHSNIYQPESLKGHQRSKTIDQSIVNPKPYLNSNAMMSNNNNYYGNSQAGGASLNNEMDAKDNLRSMRTNKQLIKDYSIDKRGKDDTLAHYGQFMIKNN